MLANFLQFVKENALFAPSKTNVLLAVSGGVDSVVLAHLFHQAGIAFGIAHCNFNLRGEESDADEYFVQQLAKKYEVPCYVKHFQTERAAKTHNESIQMAARRLRYDWLEDIRQQKGYEFIGVAHHNNDAIETLLLNLTKGCGIRGLHGILPKQQKVVRPLLFAAKGTILDYAKAHQIDYREDSSNTDTKYTRNALRHQVIPVLQKINPDLEQTMLHNFERFREAEALYQQAIQKLRQEITTQDKELLTIDIPKLLQSHAPLSLLYELLHPLGFGVIEIQHILDHHNQPSGAMYCSPTHQVLKDRKAWLVKPLEKATAEWVVISQLHGKEGTVDVGQQQLHWQLLPTKKKLVFEQEAHIAYFDYHKLSFPLQIRHWQEGDVFHPFGMGGQKKKLSKFYKDEKLSIFEKDKTWLLCDNKHQIAWVVGRRTDERFKVDTNTTKILKITVE